MTNTKPQRKSSLAWHPWKYLIPSKLRGSQEPPTESAISFPNYRHPGEQQFIAVIVIIFAIEIPLVHLILDRFSPLAAWIVTGLTLLMALWITGVFIAARQRLSWISNDELHVNDGLFTEYQVQRNNVMDITLKPIGQVTTEAAEHPMKAVLSLREPITVRSLAAPEQRKEVTVETKDTTALDMLEQWHELRLSPPS